MKNKTCPVAVFALLVLAAARLQPAAQISSACKASNQQALTLLADDGHVSEAQTQLSQLISQLDESSSDNKLCVGVALVNLASAQERLGQLDNADQTATHAVDLLQEILGPSAVALRRPLELRASIAIRKGNWKKADVFLSRAEPLQGHTHTDLAFAKSLRGKLLVEAGKFADAELAFQQSITERELAGDGAKLDIGPVLTNLALLYGREGRFPESRALLERSLRIAEAFPLDVDSRIKALVNLAVVEALNQDAKPADAHFRDALNLIATLPPTLLPVTGRAVYREYTLYLQSVGRKREAKATTDQANSLFGSDPTTYTVSVDTLRAAAH